MLVDIIITSFSFLIFLLAVSYFVSTIYTFILKVPPITTKKKIVRFLSQYIKKNNIETMYDLGCGTGEVVQEIARRNPKSKIIGFEKNPPVFLVAWMKIYFSRITNAQIFYKNFFEINLNDADVLYCYLFPGIMKRLEEKVKRYFQKNPKGIVISNSFPFPNLKPKKIITVDGSELYIYVRM